MIDLRDLGTFVVFVAGVVFLLWGLRNIVRTILIMRSGGISTGTLRSMRVDREERLITVSFSTPHGYNVQFEQLVPPFCKSAPKVFYDIAQPQRATVSPRLDVIYGLIAASFGTYFISETYEAFFARLF